MMGKNSCRIERKVVHRIREDQQLISTQGEFLTPLLTVAAP